MIEVTEALTFDRLDELKNLTIEDETDSPLERLIRLNFPDFDFRHGAYDVVHRFYRCKTEIQKSKVESGSIQAKIWQNWKDKYDFYEPIVQLIDKYYLRHA